MQKYEAEQQEIITIIDDLEEKLSAEKAVCRAVSVVMGCENGERSYKISYKKPDSKSYAYDIAYKYGITFEQLSKI